MTPKNLPISISISVVYYDTPTQEVSQNLESIIRSIRHLEANHSTSPTTIFLIDNSEKPCVTSEHFESCEAYQKGQSIDINIIKGQGNIGYGSAHNLILNSICSDCHLVLNPDVQLDTSAITEAVGEFERNEDLVLLSPNAKDALGKKQYLCKNYPSLFTLLVRGCFPPGIKRLFDRRLAKYEMREIADNAITGNASLASGCFMFLKTDAFRKVGGFDQNYFLYFEDFDLSLRLQEIGEIVYAPQVRIIHTGGNTAKKGIKHIKIFIQSGIRFFNTYGWRLF